MKKHAHPIGVLALGVVMAGCGAAGGFSEPAGELEQGLTGGSWVGPISDETNISSGACFGNAVGVFGAQCKGSYCDNNYIYCKSLMWNTFPTGPVYQTQYISGTGPFTEVSCQRSPNGMPGYMVGMAARGANSDEISLYCQPALDGFPHRATTPFFSEEQGKQDFEAITHLSNALALGIQCQGKHCDQVAYEVGSVN